jgi:hypothetical protein
VIVAVAIAVTVVVVLYATATTLYLSTDMLEVSVFISLIEATFLFTMI